MSWPGSSQSSTQAAGNALAQRFLRADRRIVTSLLAIIPATSEQQPIRVTLLDDTVVTGNLDRIDGFGNIILDGNVTVTPPAHSRKITPMTNLEVLSVSGKRVRYVSLPKDIDVKENITKYLEILRARQSLIVPSKSKVNKQSTKPNGDK